MKVLFLSNLYPDTAEPNRGSDNAVLLRTLAPSCEIRVLCPRPTLGGGREFRPLVPDEPFHPVYRPVSYVPIIGSLVNHRLMARAIRSDLKKIRREFPFDVVLTSWIYPDACATALLAKELDFPFVAIAQGSDVHQYLQMPVRRKIIQQLMPAASSIITRSGDLARLLAKAGLDEAKLKLIYNGIDRDIFRPGDRAATRRKLKLPADASIILFVGNFLPIKNPGLLLQAHAALKKPAELVMLGSGSEEQKIKKQAAALKTSTRVHLPGRKSPAEVAQYMQAANVLCLSSENEGFPNVILEAFACGLPVVSTRVGGISELLNHDYLGRLVEKGNQPALTDALAETLGQTPETERISKFGSQFSWERAAKAYLEVLLLAKSK